MFKKIASNTISQILSKVITAVLSLVLLSALTHYLSIELFGIYSKIYNYLGIFAFLADLGLYTIMVREIANLDKTDQNTQCQTEKIVWNILTLRAILWLGIIFLALLIWMFLPGYNSYIELGAIAIVGVFTLVSLLNSTFLAYMQSQQRIEFSLISTTLGKVVNLWLVLWIIYSSFYLFFHENSTTFMQENGLFFIFSAGLAWISLTTFLNYLYASKTCRIRFLFDREYIFWVFRTSLPYGLALFLSVFYFKADIILLSLLEPGTTGDISIALYSLPMKVIEVLMVIVWFYLNSILPKLSTLFSAKSWDESQTKENKKELDHIIWLSAKILIAFWTVVLLFGTVFSTDVLEIITREEYIDGSIHDYTSLDAFLIVLGVLLFYSITSLFIYILIAAKKQSILLIINIIVALVNIIWNIVLIPIYSFVWAGIVTLWSQILLLCLTFFFARKIYRFNVPFLYIGQVLLLSVVLFFCMTYIREIYNLWKFWNILVYWVAGFGLYVFFIYRELGKTIR